jgi:UDP-N-acetylglucosamine acyltransferase
MAIAASADVGEMAKIGSGVSIGRGCIVEDGAEIGEDCVLGPNVVVFGCAKLGPGCRVHAGAVIGDVPQDLHCNAEPSFVEIGAETTLREHVTIHRASKPGGVTRLGTKCLLMAGSHVGHDAVIGNDVVMVNHVLIGGHAQVADQAVLSGGSMVHQFTRIGRLAMLAGGSGARMDVPPFCMTCPMMTNSVMSLNVVGLRRAGLTSADRRALQHAFHVLYRSGLPTKQALAVLDSEESPYVREMIEFVRASTRGICPFVAGDSSKETREETRLRLVG